MDNADIGIYGMGVMGANLALNLEEKGYTVAVYNRTVAGKEEEIVEHFIKEHGDSKNFIGAKSVDAFIRSLKTPRRILLMVKAGNAVDQVIENLLPKLEAGDILIDGGNSHYQDTERRWESLKQRSIHFIGMGVSGGEEGARNGPSLMPGGSAEAWKLTEDLLKSIAAQDPEDQPCCTWIGEGGAGHFVKMVHNGIEYADMQLIAESYHLMKSGLGMDPSEIASAFSNWNEGILNSFLLEITADILGVSTDDSSPLVEKILDSAGQKGTGLWTSVSALESGTPLPVISSAVFARVFSSFLDLRERLSAKLEGPKPSISGQKENILQDLKNAMIAGRTIILAEGFFLIRQVAQEQGWEIDGSEVARIWQNGCIIRSELLKTVRQCFIENPQLEYLLEAETINNLLAQSQHSLRNMVALCVKHGIPCPAMSNAITSYDTLRAGRLPANIIQAQRDYFGAHTYERIDRERNAFFHTNWQEKSDKN